MAVRVDTMNEGDIAAVVSIEGPTHMSEEQVRAELQRPWAHAWVAREEVGREEEDEEGAREPRARDDTAREGRHVAAYVIAWHVADELHVLNVATREDRRRRGIARQLMDHVVAHARAARVKHLLLEVRRSNAPAIALYRALGFFAMGVRSRYYPDDEDAIEMVLAFDLATGEVVSRADEVRLHG
jgi:ribosomal-protein-alanine N-acetyltransferase